MSLAPMDSNALLEKITRFGQNTQVVDELNSSTRRPSFWVHDDSEAGRTARASPQFASDLVLDIKISYDPKDSDMLALIQKVKSGQSSLFQAVERHAWVQLYAWPDEDETRPNELVDRMRAPIVTALADELTEATERALTQVSNQRCWMSAVDTSDRAEKFYQFVDDKTRWISPRGFCQKIGRLRLQLASDTGQFWKFVISSISISSLESSGSARGNSRPPDLHLEPGASLYSAVLFLPHWLSCEEGQRAVAEHTDGYPPRRSLVLSRLHLVTEA